MSDTPDANLELKKRARRRLVGAVAFAGLAAVVLPMVMDDEPKQQVRDVQIRIPGQDQTPFNPKVGKPTALAPANETRPAPVEAAAPAVKPVEPTVDKPLEKAPEKKVETAPAKGTEKAPEKPAVKSADKPTANPNSADAQRAAAILSGKTVDSPKSTPAATSGNGGFVILIGAFANPANVKQLQTKIGELGIKVFTEPRDSPEGKKTRVRAGPFANRDAADKALDKMKRIGVNGVVAARQ